MKRPWRFVKRRTGKTVNEWVVYYNNGGYVSRIVMDKEAWNSFKHTGSITAAAA